MEREAAGEFDYLLNDTTDSDDALRDPDRWDDPDYSSPSIEPDPDSDGSFDAFDSRTWHFEPAPTPWYRTKPALTALIAAAAAAVALVVSAVLLVFRSPSTAVDETLSVTPTAPTTVASTQSATDAAPPPPQPPPSTETSAESIDPAPVQTDRPNPRTTKDPEIGVTRTPITRSPISVAPSRPGGPRRP